MKWTLGAAAGLIIASLGARGEARPVLYDAAALNIGVNCQWQQRCMKLQRTAMERALSYLSHSHLPRWRMQLCSRNATRGRYSIDWIGYDNCIRNAGLKRPAPIRKRRR